MKFKKTVSLLVLISLLASMCVTSFAADYVPVIINQSSFYDFSDGEVPEFFVANTTNGELTVENGVLKFCTSKSLSSKTVVFTVDMSGIVPNTKTGVYTYEYDWKQDMKSGLYYDWGSQAKPQYPFMEMDSKSMNSSGYVATSQTKDGWNHVKIVINYTTGKLRMWYNDDAFKTRDLVGKNVYLDGVDTSKLEFIIYENNVAANKCFYLDNFKFTHEKDPEILSEVTIAGTTVPDLDPEKFSYEINLYDDALKNISAEDIVVGLAAGFEDATVTKTIENDGNNKIITIGVGKDDQKKDKYVYTYTILCKKIVEVMEVVITECRLDENKLIFVGNVCSARGPRETDVIVDTYKNNDSPPDIGESDKNVTVQSDANGDFSGSLILDDSGDDPEVYTLNVRFYTNEDTESLVKTLQYANDAQYKQSVENLSNSSEGIFEFMTSADGEITAEQNKILFKTLGIWLDEYESLDDATAKSSVNAKVEEYKSQLTNENIYEIVNGSLAAVMLPRLSVADGAKMLSKYDEHTDTLFINDTSFSELDLTSQEWIVGNAVSNIPTTDVRTRAIAPVEFETYETLITEVRKSMLLELVDTTPYVDLADLILENDDLIDDTDGSLAKLQGMTDDEKIETVMTNVKLANENSKFATTFALISKIGREIDNLPIDDDDGYHGGGGSSGGSGGSGSGDIFSIHAGATAPAVPTVPAVPSTPTEQTPVFSDMIGYDWAKEAVNSLYEAKIVSGTGDDSFSPQREVTREEFIKLVCEAFDVEKTDGELKFSDAKAGEWYYPYVTYGVNFGIIKGISEDCFGVGQHITREDMAVIIKRALEVKNVNIAAGSLEFNDADSISDYATDAVATLTAAGIINGVGGNHFSPKATATRAEAAVIIYRCMSKYFK